MLFSCSRRRAQKRGIEFSIDLSDIVIPEFCPILGVKLATGIKQGRMNDLNPSLDRIDSSKGYVKGNVWVISWHANRLKHDASKETLIAFAKGVLRIFGDK